jgi:hypothetical protein
MQERVLYSISEQWNAEDPSGLKHSTFLVALYLRVREREGQGKAKRTDLLERLPISERTLDGVLATLNRMGLLVKTKTVEEKALAARQAGKTQTRRQRRAQPFPGSADKNRAH